MCKVNLFCVGFHVDIVHSVVADSFARNVQRQTSLMQVGCDIDTGNDSTFPVYTIFRKGSEIVELL